VEDQERAVRHRTRRRRPGLRDGAGQSRGAA
jgi:hypothetical protein